MKNIKFRVLEGMDSVVVKPKPAKKCIPEWYKKMRAEVFDHPERFDDMNALTIKGCPPVLDYLRTGYIMSTYTDLTLVESGLPKHVAAEYRIEPSLKGFTTVDIHHPDQVKGSCLEGKDVYKMMTPFHLETPPGYSCLFIKPQFSDTKGIDIIPAVVDTDLHHLIHFPFTLDLLKSENKFIPKDTPFVHIIPFKREEWQSSFDTISDDKFKAPVKAVTSVVKYFYKNLTRNNKRTFL